MMNIADIRKDYKLQSLQEAAISGDPFIQFDKWWNEAIKSDLLEVNAMTLATVTATGMPSARIVLLKAYDDKGFVFFTNYQSKKGQDIATNPHACLVFFWKELERQVRILGTVEKISEAESDTYFNSRPLGSRISACVSPQSNVIASKAIMEVQIKELEQQAVNRPIKRPGHWGGYIVKPFQIEFWQGRPSRLHDRIQYTLNEGNWVIERLAP
jgi:pyridoxamine 5'-phosphate oxidase